ncbi:MAG: ORF6N domain-containing protein [Bryobacteraceae bacterium]
MIERRILLIRGHKVMLDSQLAELYQVATGNLNKAVRSNLDRFPDDFMFQLTKEEAVSLRFQGGIANEGFTEAPPDPPKRPVGFVAPERGKRVKGR